MSILQQFEGSFSDCESRMVYVWDLSDDLPLLILSQEEFSERVMHENEEVVQIVCEEEKEEECGDFATT